MRKFKFRIWHKKENRFLDPWAEEDPIISLKDYDNGCEVFLYERENKEHSNRNCSREDVVIQQWIGLLDCNRIHIYEGDIIVFDDSEIGGSRCVGEVVWCDDLCLDKLSFGLIALDEKTNDCLGYLPCSFLGSIEIIGNIFEGIKNV